MGGEGRAPVGDAAVSLARRMVGAVAQQARAGRRGDRRVLHAGRDLRPDAGSLRLCQPGAERRAPASFHRRSCVRHRRARPRRPQPVAAGDPHLDGGRARHHGHRAGDRNRRGDAGRLLPGLGGQGPQRLRGAGLGLPTDPDRSAADRRHRAGADGRDHRCRVRQLGRLRPHRAGGGVRAARERVRCGRPRPGQGRPRDHGPAPAAERGRVGVGDGLVLHRDCDHR